MKTIITLLLIVIPCIIKSQSNDIPDINADRPGMANPPYILQPGQFQIETGFSNEKITDENNFKETTLFNTTLLRYALNKFFEVRAQSDYAQLKTNESKITGFDPLIVGTKIKVSEEKGLIPQTSFALNLTLPYLGNKDFRPDNIAPSMYLLMQNDFTDKMNICYNIGLEYYGESATPSTFTAACYGYNFTDKLSGFIENYNWFSKITSPQNFIDLGFAYLTGKNFQIDVSGNMNLRDFRNYFMINFGVSWRIIKSEKKKRSE